MNVLTNNYSINIPNNIGTTENNFHTNIDLDDFNGSIFFNQRTPILNARIEKLLFEFSQLQDNWDEDGGLAPNHLALNSARNISLLLKKSGQKIYHAAPGPNGEIMLDIRSIGLGKSIEIIFYPNKAFYVTFSNTGKPQQGDFKNSILSHLLEWLNGVDND